MMRKEIKETKKAMRRVLAVAVVCVMGLSSLLGCGSKNTANEPEQAISEPEMDSNPAEGKPTEAETITSSEYSADALIGTWAEKIAGRGVIEVSKGSTEGTYHIGIDWANGATEHYQWEIIDASATGENEIAYTNCVLTIHTYDAEGEETLTEKYNDGTGKFSLNADNEMVWQDDVDHSADDTSFANYDLILSEADTIVECGFKTYEFETFEGISVVIDENNVISQETVEDVLENANVPADAEVIAPGRDFVYLADDEYYYVEDAVDNLLTIAKKVMD